MLVVRVAWLHSRPKEGHAAVGGVDIGTTMAQQSGYHPAVGQCCCDCQARHGFCDQGLDIRKASSMTKENTLEMIRQLLLELQRSVDGLGF